MSLLRASLSWAQAVAHHYAMTPPNKTQPKDRYHTEEPWVLQIAPYVFYSHSVLLVLCAVGETLACLAALSPTLCSTYPISTVLCSPSINTTPLFLIGTLSLLLGTWIRLDCFATLGKLFTFDLTFQENHKLVTERFYGYVRHPAYTGSLLLVFGITFSHLTEGSWFVESLPIPKALRLICTATWWCWCFSVGISRAQAEDAQMQKQFGEVWETYRDNVGWWFFPGVM
ncbi:hypothetical protein AAF712_001865 [Marasmius tenuissimus]|uniref:Protein-S-isoprenylcysteine O-methyltransferase n=1 Tax=Marasmius tenuissimus TaxID=585030 RepID=A0ABR3AD81_9AGAR